MNNFDRFRVWLARHICSDRLFAIAAKNYHWRLQREHLADGQEHSFEITLKDNIAGTTEEYDTNNFVLVVHMPQEGLPWYARSGGPRQLEAYLHSASHMLREYQAFVSVVE